MKKNRIRWRIAGITLATILTFSVCEKSGIGEKFPQTVAAFSNTPSSNTFIVYLATLSKLSLTNLPTGKNAAKEATGRIGQWIDAHHYEN